MQGNGYGYFVSSDGFTGGLAAKFTETGFSNQATSSVIASFKAAGANSAAAVSKRAKLAKLLDE
jgi:hypothetical protein